jgi:hypothetical protein
MRLAETGVVQNFDIAPDGKRIVALMPDSSLDEPRAASRVVFLQNFTDEIRRRTGGPRSR